MNRYATIASCAVYAQCRAGSASRLDAGAARGDRLSVTASSDIAARGRRTSSYTHPRTVYTLVGRGGARRSFARPRARVYSPDAEIPLPVTSRDYDGRLYRTQEVALSGHTAVAPPSIPGLAVYLGLTWAGCSPLVRCVPPPGRRGLWVWRM